MSFDVLTHSERSLFNSIKTDSLSKFSELYVNGRFVNKKAENSDSVTFLGEAVKQNALRIAEFIIDNDPDEMFRADKGGNIPLLHMSFLEPNKKMIALFERKGFDFSKGVGARGNILHVVAPHCELNLFKSLIEKGAHPTELNGGNEKPHDIAKRWSNHEVDSYLDENYRENVQHGFDFSL